MRDLVLSTFEYWKDLDYKDWKYIYENIEGNELGEFYMNYISKTYLGIDPKFKSSKGFRERIFPNTNKQTKRTPEFIENLKGYSFGINHGYLENSYLKIKYLIEYSEILIKQKNEFHKNNCT